MQKPLSSTVNAMIKEHAAPILLVDPHTGRILYANPSAENLFGKKLPRETKKLFADTKKFERHIAKAREKPNHHFKIALASKTATIARIDTSLLAVEQSVMVMLVLTDITKSSLAATRIKETKSRLSELNRTLLKRVEKETALRAAQDMLIIQQSKMAAMGEMIDAIAHQWQQPLNSLSFYTSTLREDFRTGTIDADHVADITRNMEQQIDHLVTTLSVFRNFYRDDRKNREFSLEQVVRNVMLIMNDQLIKHTVSVVFEPECDVTIKGIENEFKHILINLINNAKEAFESRKLPDRTLNIRIGEDAERFFLTVEDNAGGIPETLLPELFKQHVTTKKETGGSGVGLYLARLIAAKHGMQLSASNVREGACFTLCLPK